MKLEPHLPQLPSVGELLEHPRVKGVVARINRSTLAHRAAGFIEELRHSLAQRTGRVEVPSVTQLAERLARRLLGEPPAGGPVINATGIVVGHGELLPPLTDAAAQAMMQVACEYHDHGKQFRVNVEAELCRLSSAEAALVVSSFDAALEVVAASLCAGRDMVVIDRKSVASRGAIAWPKLAARHGAVLHTISEAHEELAARATDNSQVSALFRSPSAAAQAPTAEMVAQAKRVGAAVIDVAPMAGLLDPAAYGLQPIDTLRARLERGADLVIADGAGLLGGPSTGIIVGKRQLVQAAANHKFAHLTAMGATVAAALSATLAEFAIEAEPNFNVPVWQQLSAPLANLQQRSERLAMLIGAVADMEAAAIEAESPWCGTDPASFTGKTWIVAVRSQTVDANGMLALLRRQPYPVVARVEDGAGHLDLRSVFPRWDQQIVAAFEQRAGDVTG